MGPFIGKVQAREKFKRLARQDKQRRIPAATDAASKLHINRTGVAETFAQFYEALYSPDIKNDASTSPNEAIHDVSLEEVGNMLSVILNRMKKNKTCSEDGLVAEMLQTRCEDLIDALECVFADLLRGTAAPPDTWDHEASDRI